MPRAAYWLTFSDDGFGRRIFAERPDGGNGDSASSRANLRNLRSP
jgi:hypothetical protein